MQTHKIAIFYLIGQFHKKWATEFYEKQINLLYETGLYECIEFIDIHVAGGKQILPILPDKIRKITYHSNAFEEEIETIYDIWDFCSKNNGYKVLFYHSMGVTYYDTELFTSKMLWKKYIEDCNIVLWKECSELLNFYDCVGADYRYFGSYADSSIVIRAPHYPGTFWWATADYIKRIDPNFLRQDVVWKKFLAENFIGAGNPRYYSISTTDTLNFYLDNIEYDINTIKYQANRHIDFLKNQSALPPSKQYFKD